MVYTVFYKTSSFVGYCFLSRYSIHPQRHDVFSLMLFEAILVEFQICSFIDRNMEKVVEAFAKINVSPVTISKRHDIKYLKNLYAYIF